MTSKTVEETLQDIYYDPSHPGGFAGVESVFAAAKKRVPGLKRTAVRKWLEKQDTYTLHKASRRRYRRNKVIVDGIDDQWQADLVDLSAYAKFNNGTKWLLTCIDVFSKYD